MLSVKGVSAGFQARQVLHDISFSVERGDTVLLTGPNGCGKSTLLGVISGLLEARGRIFFKNLDITRLPTTIRARSGIGSLLQTRNIFPSLTAGENLRLAFWDQDGSFNARRDWAVSVFPMLAGKLSERAGLLSGGERQALAISMVLMRSPDLLLLDEPSAGLSPKAAAAILEALRKARTSRPFTCIIVEHNLRLVQGFMTRAMVMNEGRIVAENTSLTTLFDQRTLEHLYFG